MWDVICFTLYETEYAMPNTSQTRKKHLANRYLWNFLHKEAKPGSKRKPLSSEACHRISSAFWCCLNGKKQHGCCISCEICVLQISNTFWHLQTQSKAFRLVVNILWTQFNIRVRWKCGKKTKHNKCRLQNPKYMTYTYV